MKPVYRFSRETAVNDGDIEVYRESRRENIRCREFLDEQLNEKFNGFTLPDNFLEKTVDEFGYDRTMWVIANSVADRKYDGRFNATNRKWSQSFNIPNDVRNSEFALRSHSCLIDCAATQIRKMYAELGLFSAEHIVKSDEPQDYEGKLLILRADVLKEEMRTPENQLFLAVGGFGCSPEKVGKKVFGEFLSDGEKTHFYRQDFVGVIADEHIPDWAREKLAELTAEQEQTQNDSPEMKM